MTPSDEGLREGELRTNHIVNEITIGTVNWKKGG